MPLAKSLSCSIFSHFPQPGANVTPARSLSLGNVVKLDNVYEAFAPRPEYNYLSSY